MFQTMEQDETPEEEMIGRHATYQRVTGVMVVKMIKELGRKLNEQKEVLEVVSKEKL